jgi:UDP-N-acetylmuramoylalanine--D-glutamate ligase
VVGLARSGTAAALALRERGYEVIGVDAAAVPRAATLEQAGVSVHVGEGSIALLEQARAVVKSPGVPATEAIVQAARDRALPVLGELELAWRMSACELIAVTGTNGKTTTTELIAHLHRKAGLPVAVAGNVGVPLSALTCGGGAVSGAAGATTIVCEVSSFQLEDAVAFAPEAALLINLSPDHLDRHGSFAAYRRAKLRIFARQRPGDLAVLPLAFDLGEATLGKGVHEVRFGAVRGAAPVARGATRGADRGATRGADRGATRGVDPVGPQLGLGGERLWWRGLETPLIEAHELSLRGAHNLENAMAAAAVCLARGLDADAVRAGLRDFAGVPHRLEELGERGGVLYVNDSKATNVASTLVALRAFAPGERPAPRTGGSRQQPEEHAGEEPRIHLILGGQGKGQDFGALREEIARTARGVYLIGEDAPLIASALAGLATPVSDCGELPRAVAAARSRARPGEVVLLSPGCASFDQFADFEARGQRFRELAASP